ncbi:MAG: hypothetical protein IIA59_13150 [Candidatus Marinimicrobia bacterium]|nr:hypothetical protein [Candidatus Neomarinimicrobiota bacterium]
MLEAILKFFKMRAKYPYKALALVKLLNTLRKTVRQIRLLESIAVSDGPKAEPTGKTVVFNTVRLYVPLQLYIEVILMLKLRQRGYKVIMLYDDGLLTHHDTLTKLEPRPYQTHYKPVRATALFWLRKIAVMREVLMPYSQLYNSAAGGEVDRSIPAPAQPPGTERWGEYINSSLVRFFISAPDDQILRSEKEYPRAEKMFRDNADIAAVIAEKAIAQLQPDMVISSHGIYTTWGVFVREMRKHDIEVITYSSNGYHIDALDFARNGIACAKDNSEYFDHFIENILGRALAQEELEQTVNEFVGRRFSGKANDVRRIGIDSDQADTGIIRELAAAKTSGIPVFALFPNVMWDNATTSKKQNVIFESPVEWLVETVKHFLAGERGLLVIRAHPAEYTWMPVRVAIEDILVRHFGSEVLTHENLIIISARSRMPSYRLFEYIDAGFVYNGTIGLEMIYQGIPVLVGARAPYSGMGFTADMTDMTAYFAATGQLSTVLETQEQGRDRLVWFLYVYFILNGIPLKLLSDRLQLVPNFDISTEVQWADPRLDYVVATICGDYTHFQDAAFMAGTTH